MTDKKPALSSQKTLNKQDEVIGITARPALMGMAPLIGLHLTQLLAAPLSPFQPFLSESGMMLHRVRFNSLCVFSPGKTPF